MTIANICRWLAVLCVAGLVSSVRPASAQVNNTQNPGNTRTSGLNSGQTSQAGFGGTGVNTTGFSLSSRFSSNFGRFMGGSQSIGQTTAGAAAATSGVFGQSATNSLMGAALLSNRSRFGNFGRALGFGMGAGFGNNRTNRNMGNNASSGKKVIRTHLRLGFSQPKFASPVLASRTATMVNKVLLRESYAKSPIKVRVEGRTAVLTGRVESEHARDVARRLALLEPGISEVRNELTVGPPEPTDGTSPKSSSADRRP